VSEREVGPLPLTTKERGGELIAQLFTLRQFMTPTWDFDSMAKEQGALVLLELGGSTISAAMIGELIDAVIDVVRKVARSMSN
jgi:hypothetical protein